MCQPNIYSQSRKKKKAKPPVKRKPRHVDVESSDASSDSDDSDLPTPKKVNVGDCLGCHMCQPNIYSQSRKKKKLSDLPGMIADLAEMISTNAKPPAQPAQPQPAQPPAAQPPAQVPDQPGVMKMQVSSHGPSG